MLAQFGLTSQLWVVARVMAYTSGYLLVPYQNNTLWAGERWVPFKEVHSGCVKVDEWDSDLCRMRGMDDEN